MFADELEIMQRSARALIEELSPVGALRELRNVGNDRGFDSHFWQKATELGWGGVIIPEDLGGVGLGHVGAGILARELGREAALSPFLSTAVLGTTALLLSEQTPSRDQLLEQIAAGSTLVAVAIEALGAATAQVVYQHDSEGYTLSGQHKAVIDGHVADALIVRAEPALGQGETLVFLVDADAEGLAVSPRPLVDGRRLGDLTFNKVRVGEGALLSTSLSIDAYVECVLDAGRANLAARLSGMAEEAFARTVAFLKERVQFGRHIGSFQALQHRAALMHCEIEDAWSASLKALRAIDEGLPEKAFLVAVAKAKAGEVACRVTAECLQLHGGVGMTDEFDIGLYLKASRIDAELLGNVTFHADRVASHLGY
ncbi:acyl-CoA dehydrogenase family protein [Pseudochelatococcus sp. G4_1912]|uniref:acyl-CoA dehydrogenase family protein n=1 Tax=Pseudochelatococcus sp. G4_1912 TaxID=3114288 RepID=UPI0039C6F271